MGNPSSSLDKPKLEKEWSSQEARLKLDSASRGLWDTMMFTARPYVYFNKIMVAWAFEKGIPVIRNSFTVVSVDASFREGLWVRLRDQNGLEFVATHTPRQLGSLPLFVWVPYFNEVRWHSTDWTDPAAPRSMRLGLCFKSQHNPAEPLRSGAVYLSELHTFRTMFPALAKVRF